MMLSTRQSSRRIQTHLSTCKTDLEEVGVLRVVTLVDGTSILLENIVGDLKVLGALDHKFASGAFCDLDVLLEDIRVLEALFERCNGHGLRDCAEVEDTLLLESSEVEEAVVGTSQSQQNHLGTAGQRLVLVLGQEEVFELVHVLGPHLAGPEVALVLVVLANITDDVCLLQELAHGFVKVLALQKSRVGQLGLDEQTCQTLSNQTGDVVAVLVVLFDCLDLLGTTLVGHLCIVGHTVTHAIRNVLDDDLVFGLDLLELGDDNVEVNTKFTILLVGAVACEIPAVLLEDVVEVAEQGLLGLEGDGHVVFNGVETTQDQVEETDGDKELGVQFLDDSSETAAGHLEVLEALLELRALLGLVALVNGIVPELPLDDVSQLPEVGAIVDNAADFGHGGSNRICGLVVFRGGTAERIEIEVATGIRIDCLATSLGAAVEWDAFEKSHDLSNDCGAAGGRQDAAACLHMPSARLSQISAASPFQSQLKSSSSPPHFETRLNLTRWHTHIQCPIS